MEASLVSIRTLTTSAQCCGKRNFRKFLMYGKRGTREFKEEMKREPDPEFQKLFDRGVRPVGIKNGKKFEVIPEMIPTLIVPNLDGFKLKPYVSYRVPDVIQGEFQPQDLFNAIYANKMVEDFKAEKLDELGNPIEPSEAENLTPEKAKDLSRQTGADIF
ncbi:mitochondrial ribosomal protein L41 [Oratosquilla oratoria]|uniref:mitochondrial ribosomal protein L41 n=1 Tax=Oratosquilla oratoria TaxID=337810 RepID=UPI003F773522